MQVFKKAYQALQYEEPAFWLRVNWSETKNSTRGLDCGKALYRERLLPRLQKELCNGFIQSLQLNIIRCLLNCFSCSNSALF